MGIKIKNPAHKAQGSYDKKMLKVIQPRASIY